LKKPSPRPGSAVASPGRSGSVGSRPCLKSSTVRWIRRTPRWNMGDRRSWKERNASQTWRRRRGQHCMLGEGKALTRSTRCSCATFLSRLAIKGGNCILTGRQEGGKAKQKDELLLLAPSKIAKASGVGLPCCRQALYISLFVRCGRKWFCLRQVGGGGSRSRSLRYAEGGTWQAYDSWVSAAREGVSQHLWCMSFIIQSTYLTNWVTRKLTLQSLFLTRASKCSGLG
jgi:hypothetical protein